MLPGFQLGLRWLSFERLKISFRLKSAKKADPVTALATAWQLQKLVYLASRCHLLSMTCLPRACTLHRMLGRRGIPSNLCIGATKSQGKFSAHAWVEVEGEPVGEPEDIAERFNILNSTAS
jgi:hypothetical protein